MDGLFNESDPERLKVEIVLLLRPKFSKTLKVFKTNCLENRFVLSNVVSRS